MLGKNTKSLLQLSVVDVVDVQVMAMDAVMLWYGILLSGYFICFSSWPEGIHINWLSMPPIITGVTDSLQRDLRMSIQLATWLN